MEAIHIPETATETYLERLAENISRQVARTQNKKVRSHLESMLQEVYARLQEVRRKTRQFPEAEDADTLEVLELTDEFEEEGANDQPSEMTDQPEASPALVEEATDQSTDDPDVLLLTDLIEKEEQFSTAGDDFSTQEDRAMKDRLRQIMQKFQERKQRTPEEDDQVVLAEMMQEISTERPIDSADLSEEQEEKVKNRLKAILGAVQARQHQSLHDLDSDAQRQTLTRQYQEGAEAGQPASDESSEAVESDELSTIREFRPLSRDKQFVEVLDKISKGQSINLLKGIPLSEREQDLLNALAVYLNSYKGLKKQQVFEMQHLTARSIHELDLIFKTYHIQGYLKAELTNVYNRLLNLRGRFSLLLN